MGSGGGTGGSACPWTRAGTQGNRLHDTPYYYSKSHKTVMDLFLYFNNFDLSISGPYRSFEKLLEISESYLGTLKRV